MTITEQALAKLQPPRGAPASAWAVRICACWQASVKAILEVGRLLAGAKEVLPHGAFGRMIESDLPFTARTAQMLMAIGTDPRLTNTKHVSHLPASWGTLYELTKLDDQKFEEKIADGTIRPDMMRRDIAPNAAQQDDLGESDPEASLPNGFRALMGSRQEPDDSLDYSPTPPWGTRALIERVLPIVGGGVKCAVWEPACGEGHIAEVLIEYGAQVIASDIHPYGYGEAPVDFLSEHPYPETPQADWIITNPPFKEAERFALLAIERARVGVAMFVRWQWIESVGRYDRLFKPFPPTLVAVFSERIPLHMGRWEPEGSTATAYCWVVWFKPSPSWGTGLPTLLHWIPPGQRKALTDPDDARRFTVSPVIKRSPTDPLTGEVLPTPTGEQHEAR